MKFKDALGRYYKNVPMDDKQGYFQDLPGSSFDVAIVEFIGDECIEGKEHWQDVKLQYFYNDELVHEGPGYLFKLYRHKDVHLYARGKGIEPKYSFGIIL